VGTQRGVVHRSPLAVRHAEQAESLGAGLVLGQVSAHELRLELLEGLGEVAHVVVVLLDVSLLELDQLLLYLLFLHLLSEGPLGLVRPVGNNGGELLELD